MITDTKRNQPGAAVDALVDENGSRIDVPDNSLLRTAVGDEPVVGATSPTNWWRIGVIAILIVAAILLALQFVGGYPSTDVQPGTPVAVPETAPNN